MIVKEFVLEDQTEPTLDNFIKVVLELEDAGFESIREVYIEGTQPLSWVVVGDGDAN